jgi:hypothetical protein
MSLTDLAALGSLVSGLAVLGSLIYLNIQTRQATKHQRSLMMQGRAARTIDLANRLTDPSVAAAWAKSNREPDSLSDAELVQVFSLANANLLSFEETWLEYREGLLPKATEEVTANRLAEVFSLFPIYRATWNLRRTQFDPEFVAMTDRIMQKTTYVPIVADVFKNVLAAELAKPGVAPGTERANTRRG